MGVSAFWRLFELSPRKRRMNNNTSYTVEISLNANFIHNITLQGKKKRLFKECVMSFMRRVYFIIPNKAHIMYTILA